MLKPLIIKGSPIPRMKKDDIAFSPVCGKFCSEIPSFFQLQNGDLLLMAYLSVLQEFYKYLHIINST